MRKNGLLEKHLYIYAVKHKIPIINQFQFGGKAKTVESKKDLNKLRIENTVLFKTNTAFKYNCLC